ncbi:MAG TPA: DUF4142 domain-containing protein [Gemmatimonadaceae bacterium]|nr:DUF4142 domain-containing protein [Gemmatimonadaceae bacterium]
MPNIRVRHAGVVVALTASALMACQPGEKGGGADTSMMGGAPDTDTAAPVATDTTPTLTDANIVYLLDQANAGDSARGRLAEQKGTRPEVKEFGKLLMVADHHALR